MIVKKINEVSMCQLVDLQFTVSLALALALELLRGELCV